jgi:HlyD family type I secretion membrane fusion protein
MNTFSSRKLFIEVMLVMLLLMALLVTWGYFAPVSSATQAQGHIRVEGFRKKIVPLDGGVIKDIYVTENKEVQKGDILIEFKNQESRDRLNELNKQLLKVKLDILRFTALSQQTKLDISNYEHDQPMDQDTLAFLQNTQELQHAQLSQHFQKLRLIKQDLKKQSSSIIWEEAALTLSHDKMALLQTERSRLQTLMDRDFSSKRELNQLDIRISDMSEEAIAKEASINNQKLALESLMLNEKALKNEFSSYNLNQINTLNSDKWNLQSKLNLVKQALARTTVFAPVSGTVINLQTHTQGQAFTSGAYLMDIVPRQAQLVIEADLAAEDIELVKPGNAARVRLHNYNQRQNNPLQAKVMQISPDRFVTESGKGVYRLLLKIDEQALRDNSHISLYPGMPVEALILGEKRTVLDYLFSPIILGMERSLRE